MSVKKRVLAAVAAGAMVVGGTTFAIAANPTPESYAFVARGDDAADALAASSLAGRLNAPIVLTATGALPEASQVALQSANPDNVIIAGGTAAISADVESQIRSLLPGATVERVFGATRFETAQRLGEKFPSIPASFLAVDGKANAAEEADHAAQAEHAADADRAIMADDSTMFDGLASQDYQHSYVNRIGATEEKTFNSSGVIEVMPDMNFTAPVDGFVDVSAWATSVDGEVAIETVYVMLDYTGDINQIAEGTATDAELREAFEHMVCAVGLDSDGWVFPFPQRVSAGQHTIQVFGVNFSATGGESTTVGRRSLTAHFTAGVTGQWQDFQAPPGGASASEGTTMEEMMFGRND